MSKKITLTENNVPKYFRTEERFFKVEEKTYTQITSFSYGYDIDTYLRSSLSYWFGEKVEPITKAEFVAHCNKAYKAITGFKHVEDLWVDKEGDAHE